MDLFFLCAAVDVKIDTATSHRLCKGTVLILSGGGGTAQNSILTSRRKVSPIKDKAVFFSVTVIC